MWHRAYGLIFAAVYSPLRLRLVMMQTCPVKSTHKWAHTNATVARAAVCVLLALSSTWAGAGTLIWDWSYSLVANPSERVANGTFTTDDTPDVNGFYSISALTGNRQGVAIVSFQATGTAIPQNDAYPVDNKIRVAHPGGQLTKAGFGYGLANGWYENPFLATWELPSLVYYAFLTKPGTGNPSEEPPVNFEASIRVPEPFSAGLVLSGLLILGVQSIRKRRVSAPAADLQGSVSSGSMSLIFRDPSTAPEMERSSTEAVLTTRSVRSRA
jgi:hypothetical protein